MLPPLVGGATELHKINPEDMKSPSWPILFMTGDRLPVRQDSVMRKTMKSAVLAICLTAFVGAPMAFGYTGQELESVAKVSIQEARTIALKAVPGKITDQELEKERGGSGLRYSFDIKRGGTTYEVGVDAQTGALLEHKAEGPHPD